MGHAHIGGKTVLYLLDGLYCGMHPIDLRRPRKMDFAPFNGDWTSSLLASQDPVAIDSVGFDFLLGRYDRMPAQQRGRTTTCTRRPWRTIRLRGHSTIRTTPTTSSDWPVSASTSTGTTRTRRNTPAIWGRAMASNWNLESRIQNTEFRIQNSELKPQNNASCVVCLLLCLAELASAGVTIKPGPFNDSMLRCLRNRSGIRLAARSESIYRDRSQSNVYA